MKGTPGMFRANEEYKQYEHPIKYNYGYSYDPPFFEGVDYSERAMQRAKEASDKYKNKQYRTEQYEPPKAPERTRPKKGLIEKLFDFFRV